MKPLEKHRSEIRRRVKAVDVGLDQHETLKEEAEEASVFPSWKEKDLYAKQLHQHRVTTAERAEPSLAPPTKTIMERINLRKEKIKNQTDTDLLVQREKYGINAKDLQKLEQTIQDQEAEFDRPLGLDEAIEDDDRYARLPTKSVIEELIEEGRILPKPVEPASMSIDQFVANRDKFKPKKKKQVKLDDDDGNPLDEDALDAEIADVDDEEGSDDGGFDDETESSDWDSDDERPSAPNVVKGVRGNKAAEAAKNTENVLKMLRASKQEGGKPNGVTLNTLISALKTEMPYQEEALNVLKEDHSVLQTRLNWAKAPPDILKRSTGSTKGSSGRGGSIGSTRGLTIGGKGGSRDICRQLLDEMVDIALSHIRMRPNPGEVAAEVHRWKAMKQPALMSIARHISDGVFKDCVDEIIAEMTEEVLAMHKAADEFSFDIIVEAVTFSQGKFDFQGDDVRTRLKALNLQQERILNRDKAKQDNMTKTRDAAQRSRGDDLESRSAVRNSRMASVKRSASFGGRSMTKRDSKKGDWLENEEDDDLARSSSMTDLDRPTDERRSNVRFAPADSEEEIDRLLNEGGDDEDGYSDTSQRPSGQAGPQRIRPRSIKLGQDLAADANETDVYILHRQFDDTKSGPKEDKDLYIKGLKSMLEEMRKRRGNSPYGHTQQLNMAWDQGMLLTREQRRALYSLKPALAAGPSVWKRRNPASAKIPFATFQRIEHNRAARVENRFWSKVRIRPFFMGEKGPLINVVTNKKETNPISIMMPSPSGAFLAVGTSTGVMLVYDLRNDPVNPWFRVMGDGPVVSSKKGFFGSQRHQEPNPSIMSLSWSCDSYQLASLDASSVFRVWWMRPDSGQMIADEPDRQPVVPERALTMGPLMASISGKLPITDVLHEGLTFDASQQLSILFHKDFSLTGTQPSVVIPQITGDLLRITTFMGRKTLPLPLPFTTIPPRPIINKQTVGFLMPPQIKNEDVYDQSLMRGHQGIVVYLGYLSDSTTIVSVDHRGVINLWPSYEGDRTGFGWFKPRATWSIPSKIMTYQPRGMLHPVWPRQAAPVSGYTLFGWFQSKPPPATSTAMTFEDLMSDRDLHDTKDEPKRLEAFPMGNFLVECRMLWLVRYRLDGDPNSKENKKSKKPLEVIREEIHRPSQELGTGGKALVITTFGQSQNTFLRRYKQFSVYAKLDFIVVSAAMSPSQRDLVIWCTVQPQPGDPDSFSFFACHVINLETMRPNTPRIDVYDHSQGKCAPAYALTPTITSLGSEYMFVGMGCGFIAVYSIATGQMVKELSLHMPDTATHFVSLHCFSISGRQGAGAKNCGKVILAAVQSESMSVYMYEINDQLCALDAIQRRGVPVVPRKRTPAEELQPVEVASPSEGPSRPMPPPGEGDPRAGLPPKPTLKKAGGTSVLKRVGLPEPGEDPDGEPRKPKPRVSIREEDMRMGAVKAFPSRGPASMKPDVPSGKPVAEKSDKGFLARSSSATNVTGTKDPVPPSTQRRGRGSQGQLGDGGMDSSGSAGIASPRANRAVSKRSSKSSEPTDPEQ